MSAAYWNRLASRYDTTMRVLGGPLPLVGRWASAAVGATDAVLEVGCGTGLITVQLAPKAGSLVATDYAEAMVEATARRCSQLGLNVHCTRADLTALDFKAQTFDVVVAANVLHLVPNVEQALAELRRVLRPNGRLVVPTYCHDESVRSRLVSRAMGAFGFPGQRRFCLDSLQRAVADAGFTVTQRRLASGLLPIGYVEARRDAHSARETS